MQNSQQNNKRIAKNTILLYVRMILVMGVTLYTSRIILRALGVSDYGIYNVVGGVVSMFGFINTSLGGASSRFITYALGKGDKRRITENLQLRSNYTLSNSTNCACIGRNHRALVCHRKIGDTRGSGNCCILGLSKQCLSRIHHVGKYTV